MITSVQISEDLKYVYWKDEKGIHGENITEETKEVWLDLYCKLQEY